MAMVELVNALGANSLTFIYSNCTLPAGSIVSIISACMQRKRWVLVVYYLPNSD